jgi:hypothetical protein
MQSRDLNNVIVQTDIVREGQIGVAKAIAKKLEQAQAKGGVKHVIAPLPVKGRRIIIDGLEFEVNYANHKRGDVHLKLVGPAEETDTPAVVHVETQDEACDCEMCRYQPGRTK